jgi:hypothetical protein
MANEEHVAILEKGVYRWNRWREENPQIEPILSDAYLYGWPLENANFTNVNFIGANLSRAKLAEANLQDANFTEAKLVQTDFSGTYAVGALFTEADMRLANLRRANFSKAHLDYADLSSAILYETNLVEATIGRTILGNVDLDEVQGLNTLQHFAPSTIGIDTIYRSGGNIPEVFLRGAGVPDNFITFMKSLTNSAIDLYSCFISHSSKDKEFAERLYADLQSNGVRCWYAPHHMEIGAPILNEIDKAIRVHDKLLLILSENSVGSRWVEHEVLSATTKEFQQERDKRTLFPIRLDDAVMDTRVQWARNLKDTRHIADFTGWKDHDSYKKAFGRLLQDLKGKS